MQGAAGEGGGEKKPDWELIPASQAVGDEDERDRKRERERERESGRVRERFSALTKHQSLID